MEEHHARHNILVFRVLEMRLAHPVLPAFAVQYILGSGTLGFTEFGFVIGEGEAGEVFAYRNHVQNVALFPHVGNREHFCYIWDMDTKKNNKNKLDKRVITRFGVEHGTWDWFTTLLSIIPGERLPRLWIDSHWEFPVKPNGKPAPTVITSGMVPVMKKGSKVRPPICIACGRPADERQFVDADWNRISWEEYKRQMRAIDSDEFNYNQNVIHNPDDSFTEYGYMGVSFPDLETRSGEEEET